jgi:hypothetical protein
MTSSVDEDVRLEALSDIRSYQINGPYPMYIAVDDLVSMEIC